MDAIATAYASVPQLNHIVRNTQIPPSVYAIANPYKAGIASPVLDGKIITEEPLAIGPKVPILAGAGKFQLSMLQYIHILGCDLKLIIVIQPSETLHSLFSQRC